MGGDSVCEQKRLVRLAAIEACRERRLAVEAYAGDGEGTAIYRMAGFATETNDLEKPADYQMDAAAFLARGLSKFTDLVEIDPYGSPWEAFDALLPHVKGVTPVVLVMTDGLAYAAKRGGYPGKGSALFRRHAKRLGILDEVSGKLRAYSTYAYELATRAYVIETAKQSHGVRAELLVASKRHTSHPMLYSAWRLS